VVIARPAAESKGIVERNIAKKHQKPTRYTMRAAFIDKDMPMHVPTSPSSPKDGPTRVGYKFGTDA